MVAFSLFSIDFLNGIFKSETDRVNKYTGNDPVIEEEVKKMGGFGAALVEKAETRARAEGREQRDREIIARMLRRGKSPEEIADLCEVSLEQVKQVESDMLSLA